MKTAKLAPVITKKRSYGQLELHCSFLSKNKPKAATIVEVPAHLDHLHKPQVIIVKRLNLSSMIPIKLHPKYHAKLLPLFHGSRRILDSKRTREYRQIQDNRQIQEHMKRIHIQDMKKRRRGHRADSRRTLRRLWIIDFKLHDSLLRLPRIISLTTSSLLTTRSLMKKTDLLNKLVTTLTSKKILVCVDSALIVGGNLTNRLLQNIQKYVKKCL